MSRLTLENWLPGALGALGAGAGSDVEKPKKIPQSSGGRPSVDDTFHCAFRPMETTHFGAAVMLNPSLGGDDIRRPGGNNTTLDLCKHG